MFIDQFLAQLPEAIWIFGRKALVKMNVLSFNVPKIVERDNGGTGRLTGRLGRPQAPRKLQKPA